MTATIAPYLYYENGRAAADWLCRAFGFEEISAFEEDERVTAVGEPHRGETPRDHLDRGPHLRPGGRPQRWPTAARGARGDRARHAERQRKFGDRLGRVKIIA